MSFAAGVLISVSFMHIIPKSFAINPCSPVFLLIGFMALHLFNRSLNLYVYQHRDHPDLSIGVIPMLGIGFHSFLDGMIYSVTFNVSVFTGIVAAIGMVLHEFPEGIVTFILLDRANFDRRRAVLFAFLAAGLSTPLGALISFPSIQNISQSTLGLLLSLSAGALVYVGASHLLPSVENENRRITFISLLLGVLAAVVIVLSKQ
jgi:zinc transporter ZupT